MTLNRWVALTAAVLSALLGIAAAVSSPAAAAPAAAAPAAAAAIPTYPGSWVNYGKTVPWESGNSLWTCGWVTTIASNVSARNCMIRANHGLSGTVQAAVVVLSNRPSAFRVNAAMTARNYNTHVDFLRWECATSTMAAASWAVCFGHSFNYPDGVYVGDGGVNGQYIQSSPWI
jgi:hypothetical protein